MKLTDAHELQKILPDTTRYVTVHLNNEFFFISSVSAFGSELISVQVHSNYNIVDVLNAHALLPVIGQ